MAHLITDTGSEFEFAAVCIRETGLYFCYEADPPEETTPPDKIFSADSIRRVDPDETVNEQSHLIEAEGVEPTGIPVDKTKPTQDTRVVVEYWVR